jgi:hypothetical protein
MKPKGRPQSGFPPKLKYGLPGTPEQRRRRIRAAIERHAETLRRLSH